MHNPRHGYVVIHSSGAAEAPPPTAVVVKTISTLRPLKSLHSYFLFIFKYLSFNYSSLYFISSPTIPLFNYLFTL
jgi:hypothetical protein